MKLYNTLTKKVEEFIPYNKEDVKMYTCGPTVYHDAHIGNLRCYIFEDILEKTLNYLGYHVTRCMNITDVGHLSSDSDTGEDKMVKSAKEQKKSVLEIAKYYTTLFKKDLKKLNVKWPEIVSKATDNIDEYIKIIKVLMDKNLAYFSGGNVYFDTSKLDNYYVLTNHNEEDIKIGVRDTVEEDKNKKNKTDFVLWFTKSKFEDQALKWDSPWGVGYPGWHIECSGISLKYLGEYLDIHCGGIDNIFPHHTNEIAQSEGFLGHKWCKYWCHSEHLNDLMGKMSKSKGKTLTLSFLESQGIKPLVYRLFCLNSHYRKTLVYTDEAINQAKTQYEKLIRKIRSIEKDNTKIQEKECWYYQNKFKEDISNDLNTASAITVLYDVLKDDSLNNNTKLYLVSDFDKVLSLDLLKEEKIDASLEKYIDDKIALRKQAKENKDYALADSIRCELLKKGIILIDKKDKTTYEIKEK